MMTDRKSVRIFIAFIVTLLFVAPAFAKEPPAVQMSEEKPPVALEWRAGPQIGLSPYIGVIGVEIQKSNYAVTLGYPASIGLKYYPGERGYRWFYGLHAMHFSVNEREMVDYVPYNESTETVVGAGFGYRWRWWDHLDLTLSLSAVYWKSKYTGYFGSTTEHFTMPFPGLTLGYTF